MAVKNMQNSFPYIDILIFGVIAIFLIFRLKNILGTKTGFEETNLNDKTHEKKITNVLNGLKISPKIKLTVDVDPINFA